MFNRVEIRKRLEDVLEALGRIPKRVKSISVPDDFIEDESGREHLESVCMIIIAVGEALRQIDHKTSGELRAEYPDLPWAAVIGARNVIAHGYFDIDHEMVFAICFDHIPNLNDQVQKIIHDLS